MRSIDTRTLQSISYMWMLHNSKENLVIWCKLSEKVVNTELSFSGFLVEHNFPLRTADHAVKLFRNMFPDSKMVNKYRCGCTKTTLMLIRTVAE